MVVCFINPIGLHELPFPSAFCSRPLLELELGANETEPKNPAAVEGNFLSPVDLSLETQTQELPAVILQPRGGQPADNGASNGDTELKTRERTGFWSHNLVVIGLSLL